MPTLTKANGKKTAAANGAKRDYQVADISLADLGRHFGGLLYEREARYLREIEWAQTADDILLRRTQHGLHLDRAARDDFANWLQAA